MPIKIRRRATAFLQPSRDEDVSVCRRGGGVHGGGGGEGAINNCLGHVRRKSKLTNVSISQGLCVESVRPREGGTFRWLWLGSEPSGRALCKGALLPEVPSHNCMVSLLTVQSQSRCLYEDWRYRCTSRRRWRVSL